MCIWEKCKLTAGNYTFVSDENTCVPCDTWQVNSKNAERCGASRTSLRPESILILRRIGKSVERSATGDRRPATAVALSRNDWCHVGEVWLCADHQHLSLRRKRCGNYTYRHLVLIVSRLIVSSIIVDTYVTSTGWNTEKMTETTSKAMPSQKYQASKRWRGARRCTTERHCKLQQRYRQYTTVHTRIRLKRLTVAVVSMYVKDSCHIRDIHSFSCRSMQDD